MWQANEQQQSRIQALSNAFLEGIPMFWEFPTRHGFYLKEGFQSESCQNFVNWLDKRFGDTFLLQAIPEFLVFPTEHALVKDGKGASDDDKYMATIALSVSTEWVAKYGDGYAVSLIGDRFQYLLLHLEQDPEICDPTLSASRQSGHHHYWIHLEGCFRLLVQLRDRAGALEFFEHLLLGHWNAPITLPESAIYQYPYSKYSKSAITKLCKTTRYTFTPVIRYSYFWQLLNQDGVLDILERLYTAERLDYERFILIYQSFPDYIPFDIFWYEQEKVETLSPFMQALFGYVQTLGWKFISEWDKKNLGRLTTRYSWRVNLKGARWLLTTCEQVEKLGLSAVIIGDNYSNEPMRMLNMMASTQALLANENSDEVVEQLRKFSEQTLLAVLASAEKFKVLILQALNWEDMTAVLNWANTNNIPLDRESLLAQLTQSNPVRLKRLVTVLKKSKCALYKLMFLEAVAGWNKDELETVIARYHTQNAIKAYGFLPLERGEEDLLERYLFFKKVAKDCSKYGKERQANTRAAVQTGLENLAETAGYANLAQLEWDVEANISDDVDKVVLDCRETIADWEVELQLNKLDPQIKVFKQGEPIKAVPADLRKQERFSEFKEVLKQTKEQVLRFATALEDIMLSHEPLTLNRLRNMLLFPVTKELIQQLVFRTEEGCYGFFSPNDMSLIGIDGVKTALTDVCYIAHPYHFFQDGVLSDWQEEVFKLHRTQPFKQVFRELYVLTPEEEETAVFSNRFAGYALKANMACPMLRTEGWHLTGGWSSQEPGETGQATKRFRKSGLTVVIDFSLLWDTDQGESKLSVTSEQLRFLAQQEPKALEDVPPLFFSEVMRDVDSIVTTALVDKQNKSWWSSDTYPRQATPGNDIA